MKEFGNLKYVKLKLLLLYLYPVQEVIFFKDGTDKEKVIHASFMVIEKNKLCEIISVPKQLGHLKKKILYILQR